MGTYFIKNLEYIVIITIIILTIEKGCKIIIFLDIEINLYFNLKK